jgi:hypothetical protein
MATINEAVAKHANILASGGGTSEPVEPQNASIPPASEGTGVPGSSRGSYLPGQVFDSDVLAASPAGGSAPIRSRVFPFVNVPAQSAAAAAGQAKAAQNAAKVTLSAPKVTAPFTPVAPTAPSPSEPGVPSGIVTGFSVSGANVAISNGLTMYQVTATFTPPASVPAASIFQIFALGYQASTTPVLIYSGVSSPLIFNMQLTGETVTFYCVTVSASGATNGVQTGITPSAQLTISSPSAPEPLSDYTVVTNSVGIEVDMTPPFSISGDMITSIWIWRNTTDDFSTATVTDQIPLGQGYSASAVYVFQQSVPNSGSYYYWATCVDSQGTQSTDTYLGELTSGSQLNSSGQLVSADEVAADGDTYIRMGAVMGNTFPITNPNFTIGTAGWASFNGGTLAAQNGNPPITNGWYVQLIGTTQYSGMQSVQLFKAQAGDLVYMSADVYSDGTFQLNSTIGFFDGAGNRLALDSIGTTTTEAWISQSAVFTAPANTSYAQLFFYRNDTNGGSHAGYVTNIQLACSSGVAPNRASSLLNGQGNVPATSFEVTPITEGTMFASVSTTASMLFSWSGFTITYGDGSTTSVPASSSQFPIPAAPTCTVPSGSGISYAFAVGIVYEINGSYYVCSVSPYTSKVGTTGTSTIDSPTSVSGAVGWVPLYGNAEMGLASTYISGFAITGYIAFGTNWSGNADVSPYCAIYNASTTIAGYSLTDGGAGFFFFGLAASTTYYIYPAWSVSLSGVYLVGALLSSKSATYAIQQSGDGYICLSVGSVAFTTPASGSTSSGVVGSSGGGRGLL